MQDGGEDRALDREREAAAGEKRLDDRRQPVSSHNRPNSSGGPIRRQIKPSALPPFDLRRVNRILVGKDAEPVLRAGEARPGGRRCAA